ncbi:MAG TPA: PAS domain-containing protein [Opitutaceae bacterium]|nr:PAS domain-containing protein [Opitutaceae bacterium]
MSFSLPPVPTNESARLSALRRYRLLDTAPEEAFDGIARIASLICGTPIAVVSLVDERRQWFKATVGFETRETPREYSFCAHAINEPAEVMVVPDTRRDPRFAENPLVQNEPRVRFYAGAPLVTPDGFALGALCVVDRQPRNLTLSQQEALRVLAAQVISQFELRRAVTDLAVRLETAQRFVHIGDWQFDVVSNRHYWSDEVFRILGVARETFDPNRMDFFAYVHPEDLPRVRRFELTVRTSEARGRIDHRILRPDGQIRHVRTHAEVARDPAGNAVRMTGTVQDITEYQLSQAALHESEERYKLVSRATSDVLWDWDLAANTIWRSDGFKTVFGFSTDEIEPVLEWWSKRLHAEDRDRVVSGLRRAIDSGQESWVDEYRFLLKDGRYATVQDRGYVVHDDAGKAIRMVGGMTDLTERKKLEAQYLRAQRMESIGTLAGGIAHDLNNVLSPIIMAIDLLKLEANGDPKRLQMLNTVRASARRGADLVRQVLTFARGLEGQRIAVDLHQLVEDLRGIIAETFPRKIAIMTEIPSNLWPIIGDATQIHQVLLNLAVNARDAMPEGGTLTFAADNFQADAQYVGTGQEVRPGPYVMIAVADTGTGMPPEVCDRIFEPFFTTKEVGKGTGLGLSTVHTIVKSHGGFIHVESKLRHGTTFKVFLPADPSLARDDREQPPGDAPRGRGEWVLVVDDEVSVRTITQQTLEVFGYRVLTAADGVEAVAVFADHKKEIALVLIDMAMPVMDGPTAIHALLHIEPDVPIVAASGLASNVTMAKAAVAGVKDFLAKPYTGEALLRMIRQVLDRTDGARADGPGGGAARPTMLPHPGRPPGGP